MVFLMASEASRTGWDPVGVGLATVPKGWHLSLELAQPSLRFQAWECCGDPVVMVLVY